MKRKYLLSCVFVGMGAVSLAQSLVAINKPITQDTILINTRKNTLNIQSITASGQAVFSSKSGYVRILLTDDYGYDVLIYETSPLFAINGVDNFKNAALESTNITRSHNFTKIRVEIENAELRNVVIDVGNAKNTKTQQQVQSDRITRINDNLRVQNALWLAGETSVSRMSFEEKKTMFGGKVPDLQGFEYYKGGIFELYDEAEKQTQKITRGNSPYVSSFDWRNRHGRNWITSIKDQRPNNTIGVGCAAFTIAGVIEAYTNLYYNQLLNLDLSEQDLNCDGGTISIWILDSFIEDGVVNESCLPFIGSFDNCNDICQNPEEKIKIDGYSYFNLANKTFDDLKLLVLQSPVHIGITSWFHAMGLIGYKSIEAGDRIDKFGWNDYTIISPDHHLIGEDAWIVKNSWGTDWGIDGFGYITLNLSDFGGFTFYQNNVTSLNYTDADIVCEDRDGDGYYYWGIGEKPAHCPNCPEEPDGDDSNPCLGPMDEYGNCRILTPTINFTNQTVSTNTTVTSCGDIFVKDVLIQSGAKLILDAEGEIIMEGDLHIENGAEFELW
ncbi:MAG: hypothetical protein LBU90_08875 [Bacteroidales bacterium]|jgi:hypothetical protein|nr:hypothetical protein [Bacteroidales bacterium]